jgi:hypothetical protein
MTDINKNPLPPLSSPITSEQVALTWSAYFSALKKYIDSLQNYITSLLHNSLGGLQGGSANERYHLTATQHDSAAQLPIFDGDHSHFLSGAATLERPNHNQLLGLQGGAVGDYQHLTSAQLAAVASIASQTTTDLRPTIAGYVSLGVL